MTEKQRPSSISATRTWIEPSPSRAVRSKYTLTEWVCTSLWDLVQRAVAPAVERAPPHEPVAQRRVLEHGVGDENEVVLSARLSGEYARSYDAPRYASRLTDLVRERKDEQVVARARAEFRRQL